jgi:hypothetical protein
LVAGPNNAVSVSRHDGRIVRYRVPGESTAGHFARVRGDLLWLNRAPWSASDYVPRSTWFGAMDLNTGGVTDLGVRPVFFDVDPAGERLAWSEGDDVYVADIVPG